MTESRIRKALQRHKVHLPDDFETLVDDPDDAFYSLSEIESVRKVKGGAVRVNLKGSDPVWYYRRVEISRADQFTYSPWELGGYRYGRSFETISEAVQYIESRQQ